MTAVHAVQQRRRVEVGGPVDLTLTMGPLQHGPRDPSCAVAPRRAVLAARTPDGPAAVEVLASAGGFDVTAWGKGAAWMLEQAPDLVGAHDVIPLALFRDDVVGTVARACRGMRLTACGLVFEQALATIVEQRVTSAEAHTSWARLVRRYGEPAPGPLGRAGGLRLPPSPDAVRSLTDWDLKRSGIERKRAVAMWTVAAEAIRLQRAATEGGSEALDARLRALPGVGPWTAAWVRHVVCADADAVPVGDWHLPSIVAFTLTGERHADDERMLELLAPYAGHRARVLRMIASAGAHPDRRAPKVARTPLA